MTWLIGTLVALAPFAVWELRAYLASLNLAAANAERQAGRDAQENGANDAEAKRLQKSSDAGLSAQRLPIDAPDPYDEAGK